MGQNSGFVFNPISRRCVLTLEGPLVLHGCTGHVWSRGGQDGLQDGRVLGQGGILGQEAQRETLAASHGALGRVVVTGKAGQQGSLSRAVRSHQREALPFGQVEAQTVKEGPLSVVRLACTWRIITSGDRYSMA